MFTGKIVPVRKILRWTRTHIAAFLVLGFLPVFLFDIVGLKWLHVPWLPLGVVGTAVAFIVGFKNNASYDRLWEARKIWGGIVNASRSFTVMVKDFVQDDRLSDQERRTIHREMVHRHVAWMTALRYQLRMPRSWENERATPANKRFDGLAVKVSESDVPIEQAISGYISEEDRQEVFAKGNQASQLLGIQSRRLRELRAQETLDVFEHVEMERGIVEFYTLQGQCERIKNFPYPRQFATLNYMFVWLFIFLLPYGVMEEFEKIGNHIMEQHAQASEMDALWRFMGDHFEWLSIPFSAIVSWVFYALEIVGEHSENPFEGGPNDVPITDLTRSIEIDIRQLIDDTDIPPPLTWDGMVVM